MRTVRRVVMGVMADSFFQNGLVNRWLNLGQFTPSPAADAGASCKGGGRAAGIRVVVAGLSRLRIKPRALWLFGERKPEAQRKGSLPLWGRVGVGLVAALSVVLGQAQRS